MASPTRVLRVGKITVFCFSPCLDTDALAKRFQADAADAGRLLTNTKAARLANTSLAKAAGIDAWRSKERWVTGRSAISKEANSPATSNQHGRSRINALQNTLGAYALFDGKRFIRKGKDVVIGVTGAVYQSGRGTAEAPAGHVLPANPTIDSLDMPTVAMLQQLPTLSLKMRDIIGTTNLVAHDINQVDHNFEWMGTSEKNKGRGGCAAEHFRMLLEQFARALDGKGESALVRMITEFSEQGREAFVNAMKKTRDESVNPNEAAIASAQIEGMAGTKISNEYINDNLSELQGCISTDLS